MELHQLWAQFQTDARVSYRLYSHGIDRTRQQGEGKLAYGLKMARLFFWAVMDKLSPARRVLLLAALVLFLFPGGEAVFQNNSGVRMSIDLRFWGGLLLLVLFLLEVADRVVMKRDLQIARDIQGWLLPATPPRVPGLEIAFATRPANTVAGDYYDVFLRPSSPLDKPTYLLAVADVAGKSIPAALLMATFQASLKTLSATSCCLADLADAMNRYACTSSQGGARFTTAVLAEYDSHERVLTYINAGHNPPILRRANGTVEKLDVGGVPFGIVPFAGYQSACVRLEPGDWLAIYTDGVVEAENKLEQEYGEERFIANLNSGCDSTPQQLLSRILVDVDLFIGNTPQHDDLTCVLIHSV